MITKTYIFTDASFDYKRKLGSWSFLIRTYKGKFEAYDMCPRGVRSPQEAELYAVKEALKFTALNISDESDIELHTDSMHIVNNSQKIDGMIAPTYDIEVIHVKAHTNDMDWRSEANRLCDYNAKSVLAKLVE